MIYIIAVVVESIEYRFLGSGRCFGRFGAFLVEDGPGLALPEADPKFSNREGIKVAVYRIR
jgi:hypothetical protein